MWGESFMEFMSRGSLTQQPQRMAAPEPVVRATEQHVKRGKKEDMLSMGSRIGTGVLLVIIVILVALVAWFTVFSTPSSQSSYVDSSTLQAVFLNTGQVYFGNVKTLNSQYFVLGNVYYLQSSNGSSASSTNSNQNVSLVKLGCELHRPYDTMVINTAQITFWENLQSDGQVAKAVAQFEQQNPNGQKCSTTSNGSSSNPQSQASTNATTKQ
ncbi:MAG TPA: hypothetical protein VN778_05020 [Verrucomicrobiae bacterium]|nr:hypothetical protein [Verrucomicrobiae bacterium]